MRVKVSPKLNGDDQHEKLVLVNTEGGRHEEVIVHPKVIEDNSIQVGFVAKKNGSVLVELPQESALGNWRIWVSRSELIE